MKTNKKTTKSKTATRRKASSSAKSASGHRRPASLGTRLIAATKTHKNAIIPLGLGLVLLSAFGVKLLSKSAPEPLPEQTAVVAEPAQTSETLKAKPVSPLTGLPTTPSEQSLPVVSVIIENSPAARPQSGLNQAGIVVEAQAEGGITRFLALYQGDMPSVVGPIRSLRPYFNDFILGFDASVAHVGGSAEALGEVPGLKITDLDEQANSDSYYRINSRHAPHNAYAEGQQLLKLTQAKGKGSSDFTGLYFNDKDTMGAQKATSFTINPASSYSAGFRYDSGAKTYYRSTGGVAQSDADGQPITTENIIVVRAQHRVTSSYGHLSIDLVGSGEAQIYSGGTSRSGQWSKPSRTSNIAIKNADGGAMSISPGRTWIVVTSPQTSVTMN